MNSWNAALPTSPCVHTVQITVSTHSINTVYYEHHNIQQHCKTLVEKYNF